MPLEEAVEVEVVAVEVQRETLNRLCEVCNPPPFLSFHVTRFRSIWVFFMICPLGELGM